MFSIFVFFEIRIIRNYIVLMFGRLCAMPKRFLIAKSFRLHVSKPKKIPGNIFFDIAKGNIFHKLRIHGRMQFFEKKSQSALNHVLIG